MQKFVAANKKVSKLASKICKHKCHEHDSVSDCMTVCVCAGLVAVNPLTDAQH